MSNYRMDITGDIELVDYSNIYDYISVVDDKDSFTITIDTSCTDSVKIIQTMLMDKDFKIISQGYNENKKYFINANKNR